MINTIKYFSLKASSFLNQLGWSLFWRGGLGFILALLTLTDLQNLRFDIRFSWMNLKPLTNKEVVAVTVSPRFFSSNNQRFTSLINNSAFTEVSDDFYWNKYHWKELLETILKDSPQKIGVTFFFGKATYGLDKDPIFLNSKIVWAIPHRSQPSELPAFTKFNRDNIGVLQFTEDPDHLIRRYNKVQDSSPQIFDFFYKVTGLSPQSHILFFSKIQKNLTFIDSQTILSGELPPGFFKNKTVLIGRSPSDSNTSYYTPSGIFSTLGLSTLITEHFINNLWIKTLPTWIYFIYFLLMTLASMFLMIRYPHKIALLFLIFLILFSVIFSIALFDIYHIWLPIKGPMIQIIATWILFLGYSINQIEKNSFKLEQEKRAQLGLEELKTNFISLISHDLKTPIAKIQAVTARLTTDPTASPFLNDITKIYRYSKDLNRYIQNVLKLLQIETAEFKISLSSIDPNSTINDVVSELIPLAQEKSVHINTQLNPLFLISADPYLLKEILLNVIQNAIQYSPTNSEVTISSDEDETWVIIRVHDWGNDIDPIDIPHIFDKFYRGKNQAPLIQGSGLGLYLVKYFIELHKGKIQFQHLKNQGTTVTLLLPLTLETSTPEEANDSTTT